MLSDHYLSSRIPEEFDDKAHKILAKSGKVISILNKIVQVYFKMSTSSVTRCRSSVCSAPRLTWKHIKRNVQDSEI